MIEIKKKDKMGVLMEIQIRDKNFEPELDNTYLIIKPVDVESVFPTMVWSLYAPVPLMFNKFIYNIGEIVHIGSKCREKNVEVGDLVYFGSIGCKTFTLPNHEGIHEDFYIVRDINLFCRIDGEIKDEYKTDSIGNP